MESRWIVKGFAVSKRRWKHKGTTGECWRFRLRLISSQGKAKVIRKAGFATRSDAESSAIAEAERVRTTPPAVTGPETLFLLLETYLAEGTGHLREASRFSESCDIKTIKRILAKDIDLSDLTRGKALGLWQTFTRKRLEEVSVIRTRRELGCLNRAAAWAVRREYMSENPFSQFKRPKAPEVAPKALSEAAIASLLASSTGEVRAFLLLCLFAGLRRNEALHLPWSCLDFESGVLHVRNSETFTSKSGRGRSIALHPRLRSELLEQRVRCGSSRWVFPSRNGEDRPRKSFRGGIEAAFQKAGIEGGMGCHRLRHSFCSMLALAGVPVSAISAAAGHSSLAVTQQYMTAAKSAGAMAPLAMPDFVSAPRPFPPCGAGIIDMSDALAG